MKYDFHRDFYDNVVEAINSRMSATFLLGPRGSGKTVCLNQLLEELPKAEFFDFKANKDYDAFLPFIRKMINAIKNNEEKVILLDEIQYAQEPERLVYELSNLLSGYYGNDKTKVVIAGAHSRALQHWANRGFCGCNATNIYVDFLTYSEFLRYKGLEGATPDTYKRFLFEVADFHNFKSPKEYLTGCIEETIISNEKTSHMLFDNDCDLIKDKVDLLVNICYQTLFTICSSVEEKAFFEDNKSKDTIPARFHEACKKIDNEAAMSKIESSFIESYNDIQSHDLATLNQAFVFLKQCGILTITSIAHDLKEVPDAYRSISLDESDVNSKTDIFEKFNITINHPMLYMQILKEVLKEDMPLEMPHALLSSIVECHVRGLLPEGFEYRTIEPENDNEREYKIDYMNFSKLTAIVFAMIKEQSEAFKVLSEHMEYMKCICVTKNKNAKEKGYECKDYCSYLYDLSQSKSY